MILSPPSISHQKLLKLSNLSIVTRSTRHIIGKALEHGFETTHPTQSYLVLSLCLREYSHTTNLTVDRFGSDEFEVIRRHYNRLAINHPNQNLLIFSIDEVKPIVEKVGSCIRLIILTEELSIGLTT